MIPRKNIQKNQTRNHQTKHGFIISSSSSASSSSSSPSIPPHHLLRISPNLLPKANLPILFNIPQASTSSPSPSHPEEVEAQPSLRDPLFPSDNRSLQLSARELQDIQSEVSDQWRILAKRRPNIRVHGEWRKHWVVCCQYWILARHCSQVPSSPRLHRSTATTTCTLSFWILSFHPLFILSL